MAPGISSSTTVKRGRPRGQPKAERRLKRELADKEALLTLVTTIGSVGKEFLRTANSNPVIGLATGVVATAAFYRAGVLNTFEAGVIYGLLGVEAAGDVIESIAKFIPFAPSQSSQNAFQPVGSNLSYYDKVEPTPAFAKTARTPPGYVPE